MKTELVRLKDILPDTTYQFRDTSVGKNVAELCRLISDKIDLDPVVLWKIPRGYLILDGFQRVEATRKVKGEDAQIRAVVKKMHENCENIALDIAIAANQKHGGTFERADRKKAAIRLLEFNPEEYDTVIAKKVGLSPRTIANYREEVDGAKISTRRDQNGRQVKVRKPNATKKAGTDNAPEDTAESLSKMNSFTVDDDSTTEIDGTKGEEEDEVASQSASNASLKGHVIENDDEDVSEATIEKASVNPALSALLVQLTGVLENIDQMCSIIETLMSKNECNDEETELLESMLRAAEMLLLWSDETFPADS